MVNGMESGLGMISSLAGIGSGSSRSRFPSKIRPLSNTIWYCERFMNAI